MKYNLTFWQKITLPFLWVYWKLSIMKNKKSWHEVKKGMKKHECKFTEPYNQSGYDFLKCNHDGCYNLEPID